MNCAITTNHNRLRPRCRFRIALSKMGEESCITGRGLRRGSPQNTYLYKKFLSKYVFCGEPLIRNSFCVFGCTSVEQTNTVNQFSFGQPPPQKKKNSTTTTVSQGQCSRPNFFKLHIVKRHVYMVYSLKICFRKSNVNLMCHNYYCLLVTIFNCQYVQD